MIICDLPLLKERQLKLSASEILAGEPFFQEYTRYLSKFLPEKTPMPAKKDFKAWAELYNEASFLVRKSICSAIRSRGFLPMYLSPDMGGVLRFTAYNPVITVEVYPPYPVMLYIDFVDILKSRPPAYDLARRGLGILCQTAPVSMIDNWGYGMAEDGENEKYESLRPKGSIKRSRRLFMKRVIFEDSPDESMRIFWKKLRENEKFLSTSERSWCEKLYEQVAVPFALFGKKLRDGTRISRGNHRDISSRCVSEFFLIGNDDVVGQDYLEFIEMSLYEVEYRAYFHFSIRNKKDVDFLFKACDALAALRDLMQMTTNSWTGENYV